MKSPKVEDNMPFVRCIAAEQGKSADMEGFFLAQLLVLDFSGEAGEGRLKC